MGSNLEFKRSSKHQIDLRRLKERALSPPPNRSPKYRDKLRVKSHAGRPYSDLPCESKHDSDDRIFVEAKSSRSMQRKSMKGNSDGDDELVKHMSNLPGYLLRREKRENLQENALNFGVLDWERLEKWKHKQKHVPARGSNVASCSSSQSSLKQTPEFSTCVPAGRNETPTAEHSSLRTPRSVKSCRQNVIRIQDSENASKSINMEQKNIFRTHKSCERNHSGTMQQREKKKIDHKKTSEMSSFSRNMRNNGVLLGPKGDVRATDGESNRRMEKVKEREIKTRTVAHEKLILGERDRLSSSSYGIPSFPKETISTGNSETKKRVVNLQKLDTNLGDPRCPGEQNIALLLPKRNPQNGFPEVFKPLQPRTSFDENMTEANSSSHSDIFSPGEILSSELYSDVPHSCPLPSAVESNAMSDMMHHKPVNHCSMEPSSAPCPQSSYWDRVPHLIVEDKYTENNKSDIKLTDSNIVDSSKYSSNTEITDLGVRKSRNPSPNRRFSFSLSRMGRSFSFKEGSTVPRLSSTYESAKSGPVKSEVGNCSDSSDREKVNAQNNRTRASPLRRLIDPILKYKLANSIHSVEENLTSSFWRISVSDPPHKEKHVASTIQALLKVTVKNGLPLFKFVVDNNSNILAATMKNLTSSGKDDSSQHYTICSVNEIKRKSGGWMRQGSKEKSCGYVYNVVGQMKVSTSYLPDLSGRTSTNGNYMLRESVLFGVEVGREDHESPKFMPNRELAAVVVKIPIQNFSHDRKQSEKHLINSSKEDRWFSNFRENGETDTAIVIIPEGVHASPSNGEPSSLIHRWKSGGACDCGGWDVGCKLRVLSNQHKCRNISRTYPITDHLELFVQGGGEQQKPLFCLSPLKDGIFSIEFSSSISLLQAFFICVAITNCEKSFNLSNVSNSLSEAEVLKAPNFNGGDEIHGKAPARYATNPPVSPVGRV